MEPYPLPYANHLMLGVTGTLLFLVLGGWWRAGCQLIRLAGELVALISRGSYNRIL